MTPSAIFSPVARALVRWICPQGVSTSTRLCLMAFSLVASGLAATTSRAQSANTPASDGVAPAQDNQLAGGQNQLATRFKKLEGMLLRSAEVEAGTNPARAALMQQAAALAKQVQLSDSLVRAARSLEQKQYSQAIEDQKASLENLNKIWICCKAKIARTAFANNATKSVAPSKRPNVCYACKVHCAVGPRVAVKPKRLRATSKSCRKSRANRQRLAPESKETKDANAQDGDSKATETKNADDKKAGDNSDAKARAMPTRKTQTAIKTNPIRIKQTKIKQTKKSLTKIKTARTKRVGVKRVNRQRKRNPATNHPVIRTVNPTRTNQAMTVPLTKNLTTKNLTTKNLTTKSQVTKSQVKVVTKVRRHKGDKQQPTENKPSDNKPTGEQKPSPSQPNQQGEQSSEQSSESQPSGEQQDSSSQPSQPEQSPRAQTQTRGRAHETSSEAYARSSREAERGGAQRRCRETATSRTRIKERPLRSSRRFYASCVRRKSRRSLTALEERLRLMLQLQNKVLDESKRLAEIGAGGNDRQVEIRANNLANDEKKIVAEASARSCCCVKKAPARHFLNRFLILSAICRRSLSD